jgi:hypothetical protein
MKREATLTSDEKPPIDEMLQRQIKQLAYEIWESEGCPDGYDLGHWLRAEAEVMSQTSSPDSQPKLARNRTRNNVASGPKRMRPTAL